MIEFNVSFSMCLSNINNYNHQQCLRTEPFFIYYEQNVIVGGIGDGMILLKIGDNYNNSNFAHINQP